MTKEGFFGAEAEVIDVQPKPRDDDGFEPHDEHNEWEPPEQPATVTMEDVRVDIVRAIARPGPSVDDLIQVSEIPRASISNTMRLLAQIELLNPARTEPLGIVMLRWYSILMRGVDRSLIKDLYRLYQTQTEKESEAGDNFGRIG